MIKVLSKNIASKLLILQADQKKKTTHNRHPEGTAADVSAYETRHASSTTAARKKKREPKEERTRQRAWKNPISAAGRAVCVGSTCVFSLCVGRLAAAAVCWTRGVHGAFIARAEDIPSYILSRSHKIFPRLHIRACVCVFLAIERWTLYLGKLTAARFRRTDFERV